MFSWLKRGSSETVEGFIAALNERDFPKVGRLLADDVLIVDNAGKELHGAHTCLELLRLTTDLAPDYRLEVEEMTERGDDILISGHTHSDASEVAGPTQWRARIRDGKIAEWQTYTKTLSPSIITRLMNSQN